ncbi:kinase-like protein [Wilcoxina mikolae CBS 423.85]|nr:kinase-like protein [Wilcoxina mikolae CBS 423.85]
MQPGVFSGPQRDRESNVLQQLKDSLWTHGRVMKNLGALVHGRNFYILYPVAEMDLQKFLGGLYDSFDNEAFKLHRVDVIEQTRDLAGALVFLHTGMRDREGQKIACYHMDLKPDNILIQNFGSTDHPVGVWKISDFGLSTIVQLAKMDNRYQITDDNKLASVTDVINHYSSGAVTEARNAGPSAFQPPPSKYVSQLDRYLKSDVWSFGCIFSIILNYLLGGVEKVDEFNCNRYLELDKLKSAENDFFYRPNENGRIERSPEVNRWLDALKDEYRGRWISKSVELIRETLEIEPSKRPTSDAVHGILVEIKMSLKDHSMDPLPETAEHTPNPAVGSSGPEIPIVLRPTLVLERETIGEDLPDYCVTEDQRFASNEHKDSEVAHLARGTRNTFKSLLSENASLSSLVSSPVIPVEGINTMSDEI